MIDLCFIWVPRTGGTSVCRWLLEHGGVAITKNGSAIESFRQNGIVTFGHRSLDALLDGNVLSREYYNRALKFAIVRDYRDRLVSNAAWTIWRNRLRGVMLPSIRDLAVEMCRLLLDGRVPALDCRTARGVPNVPHIMNTIRPASDWLYSADGWCHADRVLRFETMDRDLGELANDLKWPPPARRVLNASDHKRYQHYFDAELTRLARRAFCRDIELFGYDF